MYAFLGLGQPSERDFAKIVAAPIATLHGSNATFWGDKRIVNSHVAVPHPRDGAPGAGHTRSRLKGAMPAEARALLGRFFAPYNALLARLLGDDKFRW